jgi:hypothetical protein
LKGKTEDSQDHSDDRNDRNEKGHYDNFPDDDNGDDQPINTVASNSLGTSKFIANSYTRDFYE